jgi:hypothetical protein
MKESLFDDLIKLLQQPTSVHPPKGRFMFINIERLMKEGLAVEVSSRGQTLH